MVILVFLLEAQQVSQVFEGVEEGAASAVGWDGAVDDHVDVDDPGIEVGLVGGYL